MNPDDIEKLVTLRMSFGKHAGWLIADHNGLSTLFGQLRTCTGEVQR
ncbi:hypothetical protein ACM26W_16230 [Halomonas sp. HK25]